MFNTLSPLKMALALGGLPCLKRFELKFYATLGFTEAGRRS
jgi:hypothetical protein